MTQKKAFCRGRVVLLSLDMLVQTLETHYGIVLKPAHTLFSFRRNLPF